MPPSAYNSKPPPSAHACQTRGNMRHPRSPRLWAAIACFALIGFLAIATLEGKYRQAVLILIVGLAARIVIAHFATRHDPAVPATPPTSQTPE